MSYFWAKGKNRRRFILVKGLKADRHLQLRLYKSTPELLLAKGW